MMLHFDVAAVALSQKNSESGEVNTLFMIFMLDCVACDVIIIYSRLAVCTSIVGRKVNALLCHGAPLSSYPRICLHL